MAISIARRVGLRWSQLERAARPQAFPLRHRFVPSGPPFGGCLTRTPKADCLPSARRGEQSMSRFTGTTVVGLAASLALAGCATTEETSPSAAAPKEPTTETRSGGGVRVIVSSSVVIARVIDGDTLDLDNGDRIRLVQIDAPESKGECYGRKAGKVLRHLLPTGTHVRIARDRKLDNTDRYDRLLRYLFKGKQNINLTLVQKGAASVWYFQGDKGRYAAKLLRAAKNARDSDRGAWGACEAELDPTRAFTTLPKAIPPPPTPTTPGSNCHPSYEGACLDPSSPDYDCAGGSGDGPDYTGPVRVVGPDDYGLDADGDGYGCE